MAKEQQMQITTKTFIDLYRLIIALYDYELDYDTLELVNSLEKAVESKFEAMRKRQAFTEDRETKRKQYLELIGIHHDWISQNEIHL